MDLERLAPVLRQKDGMPRVCEELGECLAQVAVVFDEENGITPADASSRHGGCGFTPDAGSCRGPEKDAATRETSEQGHLDRRCLRRCWLLMPVWFSSGESGAVRGLGARGTAAAPGLKTDRRDFLPSVRRAGTIRPAACRLLRLRIRAL